MKGNFTNITAGSTRPNEEHSERTNNTPMPKQGTREGSLSKVIERYKDKFAEINEIVQVVELSTKKRRIRMEVIREHKLNNSSPSFCINYYERCSAKIKPEIGLERLGSFWAAADFPWVKESSAEKALERALNWVLGKSK